MPKNWRDSLTREWTEEEIQEGLGGMIGGPQRESHLEGGCPDCMGDLNKELSRLFPDAPLREEEKEGMTPTKKAPKRLSCWDLFKAAVAVCPRLLIYGPPGTGKSYTADLMAREAGMRVYSLTLTPDTPAAEVRGHWIQGPGGRFVWHDGPAIQAWKDPRGMLLINEIDRGSPDVQSLLYAICDDPETAQLSLPNMQAGDPPLRPHAGFRVIATTNATPEDLPEGLKDRFVARIEASEIHPDALLRVQEKLRETAQKSAMQADPIKRFSVRSWIMFSEMQKVMDVQMAGSIIFGSQWGDIRTALKIQELPQEA